MMAKKKPPKRPGRGSDKFDLRLPDGLRAKLHRLAKANSRSANSEIVDRLEKSIAADDDTKNLLARVTDLTLAITRLFPHSADVTGEAEKLKQGRPDRFDSSLMKLKPKGQHDDG
jgi:Arc-like DNA binding domain